MISVIVPLYNRETLVLDTINSVKSQRFQQWELIIVDYGSTDKGPELVKDVAADDNRIIFIKRTGQKKGASVCRNIGINSSKGNYLIFLDSDDLLSPWCMEERISIMESDDKFDYVIAPGCIFEDTPRDAHLLWNKLALDGYTDLVRYLNGDPVWQTAGVLWKKEFLIRNNLFFSEEARSSQD